MIITLIGMPGAGKTCMGKALAKKFNMKFLDGDKLIEQVKGKKLHEIIAESGNEEFKRIEEEVLLSVEDDNIILAPGGSAIYYDSFMKKCKQRGLVVYLYASPKTIIDRLGDFSKRGIVLKEGQTIYDLYNERAALLEKYSDITVNCDGVQFAKYRGILCHTVKKALRSLNNSNT